MSEGNAAEIKVLVGRKLEMIMEQAKVISRSKHNYLPDNPKAEIERGFFIELYKNTPVKLMVGVTSFDPRNKEDFFEVKLLLDNQPFHKRKFFFEKDPKYAENIDYMRDQINMIERQILGFVEEILE